MSRYARAAVMTLVCLTISGCSTVMEAERPQAYGLSEFSPGERRFDVIAKLGAPTSTVQEAGNSCDIYKIHTKGTNNAEKAGIVATEAAADFFTLGLAEVALTPAEAASKAGLHTVLFCYDENQKLVLLKDSGVDRVATGGTRPAKPPAAESSQAPTGSAVTPSAAHPG